MSKTKVLLALIPFFMLAGISSTSQARPLHVYKVPGASVIGYAKKQGYRFSASNKGAHPDYRLTLGCKFMGAHWSVPARSSCTIGGFLPGHRCRNGDLNEGWTVRKITLYGSYTWIDKPANSKSIAFTIMANNGASVLKPILMKWVEFIGPQGRPNKWQEAFKVCG